MRKRPSLHVVALLAGAACLAPVQADVATKEMLTNTCIACHGPAGVSAGPAIPSLSGMTKNYFVGAMLAYKYDDNPEGLEKALAELEKDKEYEDAEAYERYGTIMGRLAKGYTLDEIKRMAEVFAGQKPAFVPQYFDARKVEMGEELHEEFCDKCHADGGTSSEDDVGLLAGQWSSYLQFTLADYLEGRRKMPKKMRTKLRDLHETHGMAGIESLLAFYASAR